MYIDDAVRTIADDPATPPEVRQAFQRLVGLLDTEEAPWHGGPTPPPPTHRIPASGQEPPDRPQSAQGTRPDRRPGRPT